MFSRLRAKAGGRKDRNGAESKLGKSNGPVDSHNLAELADTSVLQAEQPASPSYVLPPIPRVASQIDKDRGVPEVPTIRTVLDQDTSAIRHAQQQVSPQRRQAHQLPSASTPIDANVLQDTSHDLQPVSSIDRAKASLLADKNHVDAIRMPPPSSSLSSSSAAAPSRPQIHIAPPQLRSWTDMNSYQNVRPGSSKAAAATLHKPPSSRGSSTVNEVPTPYRLDEPKEWITPPADSDAHSQTNVRPKSRLTRLNPLTFLSRRKSSQSPIEGVDDSALMKRASFTPFKDLSESYDPRIIGERVHDFSAPMPSQYMSVSDLRSLAMELPPSGIYMDPRRGSDSNLPKRVGDPSPERRHVPVFKEDFSDSAEGWRLDPNDRRNRTSTNIVDKVAALEEAEKSEKRKSSLPAFAQHMPEEAPLAAAAGAAGAATAAAAAAADDVLMQQTPPHVKLSPRPPTESDITSDYTPNSIQQTPDSLKPPKDRSRSDASPGLSPLADRSRATSPETPQTLSSLPRHLRSKTASVKSTASRFSFDMVGSGSAAQEKMLEERHRQRQAQRARAASLTGASINEEEDDFDEDDLDFEDGLEEEIPGMNDDDDEYGFGKGGVANMTLDMSRNKPIGQGGDDYEEEDIPGLNDDDEEDDEFGTAGLGGGGLGNMTLESLNTSRSPVTADYQMPIHRDNSVKGLGLRTDLATSSKDAPVITPITPVEAMKQEEEETTVPETSPLRDLKDQVEMDINDISNDGFYFDNGEFDGEFDDYDEDDAHLNQGPGIDEALLDNDDFERGKPIPAFALTTSNAAAGSETVDSSESSTRPTSLESEMVAGHRQSGLTADTSRTSLQARRSSAYGQHTDVEAAAAAGLTQENLAAYHNALAYAANQAALQGRFDRKVSGESESTNNHSSMDDGDRARAMMPPPLVTSLPHNGGGGSGGGDDSFDFDDSMDDDAIIAAANAEALENDDDGWYGQEFGFYAHTNGSAETQAFHGGFFGPAGLGQVKRSHSGRADFQEPSLTPITERSEWSNRNSMISLAMQSGISPGGNLLSPGGMGVPPQPGLAQLADQMQHEGGMAMDDMSLGALMRARRSVFGGSSTSLPSLSGGGGGGGGGGSRSGSPNHYGPPTSGHSPLNGNYGYPPPVPEDGVPLQQTRSGPAIPSSSSSSLPMSASMGMASTMPNPILSLQTQNLALRPTTSHSESSPLKRQSVVSRGSDGGRPGHSRNSSSAESVSYAMERDEDGGNQWVVEKRRTLDNGETEVLGREVVRGTL